MERKTIFGLMMGVILNILIFLFEVPIKVDAVQVVNSPNLKCLSYSYFKKGDYTGLTPYSVEIEHKDNELNFKVSNVELKTDEKVFVVVKNKAKEKPVFQSFLNGVGGNI